MMNHDRDADRAGLLGSDSDSHSQNAGSYSLHSILFPTTASSCCLM